MDVEINGHTRHECVNRRTRVCGIYIYTEGGIVPIDLLFQLGAADSRASEARLEITSCISPSSLSKLSS